MRERKRGIKNQKMKQETFHLYVDREQEFTQTEQEEKEKLYKMQMFQRKQQSKQKRKREEEKETTNQQTLALSETQNKKTTTTTQQTVQIQPQLNTQKHQQQTKPTCQIPLKVTLEWHSLSNNKVYSQLLNNWSHCVNRDTTVSVITYVDTPCFTLKMAKKDRMGEIDLVSVIITRNGTFTVEKFNNFALRTVFFLSTKYMVKKDRLDFYIQYQGKDYYSSVELV